jgi:AcrR family transcriptional regulator
MQTPGAPTETDGRTARRERNHEAVLDAVLTLFREDNLQPTPEDVAARSGVSLRSVYRYYSDRAELLRAAMARHLEIVGPHFEIAALGEGTLDERIDRFLAARIDLYEVVAPTARAARALAPQNPVIRERFDRARILLHEQLKTQFRPELVRLPAQERKAVTSALDALTQLEALDHYRVHGGFSTRDTASQLRVAFGRLLVR